MPPPQKFFLFFLSGNGAFWCILGTCFNISIRHVKQSRKAVLCANCQLVSYLTWRTYTYMLPSISIYYFHVFYFKGFNSISLKLLSADGMFIFMNTLVAYGP